MLKDLAQRNNNQRLFQKRLSIPLHHFHHLLRHQHLQLPYNLLLLNLQEFLH
jgi:hypothetical protein